LTEQFFIFQTISHISVKCIEKQSVKIS